MKTKHVLAAVGLVVAIGFAVAWGSGAQTNNTTKRPITGDSNPGLDRFVALESYLESNHDTNGLRLFHEYANASNAQRDYVEMGTRLHVLKALREGRTNDAINLLETRLEGDIFGFAESYKELPKAQQEWLGLKILASAKWYRDTYPHEDKYGGVTKAFELLDEKGGKK
jgi:hypothetical protein